MAAPKKDRRMYSKKPKYGGYRFVRYRPEERSKKKRFSVIFRALDMFLLLLIFFFMSSLQIFYIFFMFTLNLKECERLFRLSGWNKKMPLSASFLRWMSPFYALEAARLFIQHVDRVMPGPFIESVRIQDFPYDHASRLIVAVIWGAEILRKLHCFFFC